VTADNFNFGTDPLQFDFTFVQGGYQATSNYKQNYIQPVLGAAGIEAEDGAVRARFSADFFELERRALDDEGEPSWADIPFVGDDAVESLEPGMRVRIEIDGTGQKGVLYLDDYEFSQFQTVPVMEGGFGFRVVTNTRNVIVDDVYISQIDESGSETVVLNDDFNRADLGSDWINETLAVNTAPGPVNAFIQDGQLHLTNDGSGDGWLRTNAPLTFAGKTTVFEYTFVDYIEGSSWRPSPVLGAKPFEAGATNGVILVDNGTGFNYGMVNGGWAGGQALQLGAARPGMRFQIVVDAGGQSGTVYIDGVEGLRFFNIGPVFTGAFAFRTIVNRDATIDDIRVYAIEADGSETTLFEDDFNRDEIGEDWITESITPNVLPGAQYAYLDDLEGDGDNELFLDHDETADDSWFRLKKDFPFGDDRPIVIEGTYVDFVNYASVVVGSSEWIAEQIAGPILLDNFNSPWVMDTRGGNVWVRPGPIGGSTISLKVNADGRSGAFLVNDVIIREWEFAEGEAPIPAGAVGFEDPFDAPQTNASPPAEEGTLAAARYDDVRVTQLEATLVSDWMIH
ncbi:MAG: hypothetical protein ACP5I1_16110, partial [Candidatus Hinthialibacter sp.]